MTDLKASMNILDVEQGSEAWFAARAGRVTASMISTVMAKGKGGAPSATREQFKAQLVAETLTGKRGDMFSNKWTDHGNETEEQARNFYMMETGEMLETVGFVIHPTINRAGASPDALIIGKPGLVQFKCPSHAVHLATLLGAPIEGSYIKQMQFEMAATGAEFNRFVSFNPTFPDKLKMKIITLDRDSSMIMDQQAAAKEILAEVDAIITHLKHQYGDLN